MGAIGGGEGEREGEREGEEAVCADALPAVASEARSDRAAILPMRVVTGHLQRVERTPSSPSFAAPCVTFPSEQVFCQAWRSRSDVRRLEDLAAFRHAASLDERARASSAGNGCRRARDGCGDYARCVVGAHTGNRLEDLEALAGYRVPQ
jgi:hypothetical protein